MHKVAEYDMSKGPIVATKDAAKVYSSVKGHHRNKAAGELYILKMQIYICGKGYLVQSAGTNAKNLIQMIADTVNGDKIANERVSDQFHSVFKTVLEYIVQQQ